jgi:hypothetical protein
VIEQHLVEICPSNLIGIIGLRAITVFKVKLGSFARAGAEKFAAELFNEARAEKLFVEPQPGKRLHTERQKRFANVKTREFLTLEDDHTSPGARQQGGSGASCRSSPNDGDIVRCGLHSGIMLAKCRKCATADSSAGEFQSAVRWTQLMRPSGFVTKIEFSD